MPSLEYQHRQDQLPKTYRWLIVAVIAFGGMLGGLLIVGSTYRSGANRETRNRVQASMNLRRIADALKKYVGQSNGELPDSLGSLVKASDLTPEDLYTTGDTITPAGSRAEAISDIAGKRTSYLYLGSGLNTRDLDRTIVLVTERQRPGRFTAALFGDFTVDQVYESDRLIGLRWRTIQSQLDAGTRPVRFGTTPTPATTRSH